MKIKLKYIIDEWLLMIFKKTATKRQEHLFANLHSLKRIIFVTITGSLQQIRETLFLHQCSFHQKSILHPKITSVCKEVEVILNKESKLPENKVSNQLYVILSLR